VKDAFDAILKVEQAAYLEALEPARDPLLSEMEASAKEHGQPISDPEVGSFLAVCARATGAKTIVELGTNIGYGAIILARAAGPAAKVITYELHAETAKIARGFIAKAGLASRVEVREEDALGGLTAFEGTIDLLYVDCVKEQYPEYLARAVPKLSERGVVVADNVLWKGLVAAEDVPSKEKPRVEALRAFNRALVQHPQLRGVVLPLGDGVGFAVRA
jgi:predicted O-methyltransferase YrrM